MDLKEREQLDWLRQRVLNVVGHELRTPATTIRGLADAIGQTEDPLVRTEMLNALRRHAARLERLLDDLLSAAGVTTSLPVGPAAELDLAAETSAAWLALGGSPDRVVIVSDGDGRVRCRLESLRRILSAVLGNAIAYGNGATEVAVSGAGRSVVTVIDSAGPDLSEEDIHFATEAFWRGERAVTAVPGLGLGLAVAQSLAQHEGGSLGVAARPGGGMRTTIELPAVR